MQVNTENDTIDDSFDLDLKKTRDGLQGHVLSLSQYAEKTLAELKNAAQELKKRALEQAEAEAGASGESGDATGPPPRRGPDTSRMARSIRPPTPAGGEPSRAGPGRCRVSPSRIRPA